MLFPAETSRRAAVALLLVISPCLALQLQPVSGAENPKPATAGVVQKMERPAKREFKQEQLAQRSLRKRPALAADTSTSVPAATMPLDPVLTSSAVSALDTSISTDPLHIAPISPAVASDVYSSTGTATFNDAMLSRTINLEDTLLSLPPIGYDAAATTAALDLLALPDDAFLSDTLNLNLNSTGTMALDDMYIAPATKEFLGELDRMSSNSRGIRRLSLLDAVCRTLEANQALNVERLRPEIANTGIESAEGEFDTVLSAEVSRTSSRRSTLGPEPRDKPKGFERSDDIAVSRDLDYSIGLSGRAPTGTNYNLELQGNRNTTNQTNPFYSNAVNLNITQNLLRGAGCDVNMINVWTAQNNFVISLYQLQNTLVNLVTDVQKAYWDLYLAIKTLDIRRQAYIVAREQRERTEEFVRVGRSAPLEALAAQAEEASRISDIINAISTLKQRQLTFLRLLNPENMATSWRSLVYPSEVPILPSEKLVPEERVRLARYYRPDLRQAQIDLANGELEVFRSENGLLPALDFIINASLTGSGDSPGMVTDRLNDFDARSYQLGFRFSYPLQNRQARAANRRATFQKALAEQAIGNFCQIIEVDVRTAIIEIERTGRLIYSTEVTEELRRRQLEAETEKFRVGRSTQIDVSQTQRDLVVAQLDRVTAQVANINAYLELYRVEGTALQRRGIQPIHITPESGATGR